MVPNKVIDLHDARRRVLKAKKKRESARRVTLRQRISAWLSSSTTKGTVLLAGALAGLVMGAVVASVMSANAGHRPSFDAPTAVNMEQQLP